MDHIAQMIAQPWMVGVFVFIILLVALRPLYQAIFNINKVNQDLNMAIQVLTGLGKKQQEEFYNHFKTVHNQILKIPGLRHAWREFADSMYFETSTPPNVPLKVYLSHRPDHYFNRDSVLGTRLNLSQFLAYPNYLIGIGLAFTFIGLAAALHIAQAGLASGEGQQALKGLLAVASVKFISSIAGIISSLAISVLQRIRLRTFQQKLDAFCDLLEECTKYKSTEKLLHDMPKHIALGINEAISQQLSTSVTHALAPLAQEIRALAQTFAAGSEAALRTMLDEFLRELRKSSANEIQELMAGVSALKASLGELAANVESTGKNFASDTKISTAHLTQTLENFTAAFAPVHHSISQFNQSLASLESVADKIEQAGANIHHAADDNKKAFTELGKAVAEISAKLTPMGTLLADLSQSLSRAEEMALKLNTAGETFAAAADGFKGSAALIERSEGKVHQKTQALEALVQAITSPIATLERISAQLSNAAKNLNRNEGGYLARLKSRWLK